MAVELLITIDDAGQLKVTGPIDNKVLVYGMLELAKESISEHHKANQRVIHPVTTFPGKVVNQ